MMLLRVMFFWLISLSHQPEPTLDSLGTSEPSPLAQPFSVRELKSPSRDPSPSGCVGSTVINFVVVHSLSRV